MPPSIFTDENGRKVLLVPVKQPRVMVGRKYIAQRLGVGNAELSKRPWHFPDFGEKVYGKRNPMPYTKAEVDDWLSIPARARRKMYMEWKEKQNEADE